MKYLLSLIAKFSELFHRTGKVAYLLILFCLFAFTMARPCYGLPLSEPSYSGAISLTLGNPTNAPSAVQPAAGGVTNTSAIITVAKSQNFVLELTTQAALGGGASNEVWTLQKSIDGAVWDTNAPTLITRTTDANGFDRFFTNINSGAYGYWRIWSQTNGFVSLGVTNTARYALKLSAP